MTFGQVLAGYRVSVDGGRVGETGEERRVPATGGPGPDEASLEGQRALQLHAGIAAIGAVLSAFVAWIFIRLGTTSLAIVFGVIAIISLGILGWALYRKRRGGQEH